MANPIQVSLQLILKKLDEILKVVKLGRRSSNREETEKILNEDIKIETYKDKTGKYGRMLATIYRPVYGIKDISSRWVNVNNEMILEGQAIQVNY